MATESKLRWLNPCPCTLHCNGKCHQPLSAFRLHYFMSGKYSPRDFFFSNTIIVQDFWCLPTHSAFLSCSLLFFPSIFLYLIYIVFFFFLFHSTAYFLLLSCTLNRHTADVNEFLCCWCCRPFSRLLSNVPFSSFSLHLWLQQNWTNEMKSVYLELWMKCKRILQHIGMDELSLIHTSAKHITSNCCIFLWST